MKRIDKAKPVRAQSSANLTLSFKNKLSKLNGSNESPADP